MIINQNIFDFQSNIKGKISNLRVNYFNFISTPNTSHIIEYTEALIAIGDPELALITLTYSQNKIEITQNFILLKFNLLLSFDKYDEAFNLLTEYKSILSDDSLQITLWSLFKKVSSIYDIQKLIYISRNLNDDYKKEATLSVIKDINTTIYNINHLEVDFDDYLDNLAKSNRTTLLKKLIYIKYFHGDHSVTILKYLCRTSNLRFSYFKEKIYNLNIQELAEWKFSYIASLNSQYRVREAKAILDKHLSNILIENYTPLFYRKDLYYLLLRINHILGISEGHVLSSSIAKELDMLSIYTFEQNSAQNLIINKNLLKNNISSIKQPKTALILTGQIRGSLYLDHLKQFEFIDKKIIATWNKAAITRTKLNDLTDIFNKNLLKELNIEFHSKERFAYFFPETIEKIEKDLINLKNDSLEIINHSIEFDDIIIKDEFKFTEENKIYDGLFINNNLNQAKMFYMHHIGINESKTLNNIDIIIRSRPDLTFDLDEETFNFCIQECYQNKNLIYLPCIMHFGFSDQFAIGSKEVMYKYAEIWKNITKFNKFNYLDCFEERSKKGAEPLVANHLMYHGIEVRYLHLPNKKLQSPKKPSELLSFKNIFIEEYNKLSELEQKSFYKFYTAIVENTNIN